MAAQSNIVDIIVRIKNMEVAGSKSDRLLAKMILADLEFASKASISEIAAKIGVSEPTVTRFCRNLGCEGIREFKFRLAQAIAVGWSYLTAQPVQSENREQRVFKQVSESAISTIQNLVSTLNLSTLEKVAERLCVSSRVLCIGSGGTSSMLAAETQNRLFRLGLDAVSQVDGQLQRMYAAVVTPETTVLAFSTSGYAQSIIDAVQLSRQYGATTVAITPNGSLLSNAAEITVHFQTAEDGNVYKPSPSRFALLVIVDILATMVAEKKGPQIMENLRRIKQSLNVLKREDPRLPLGD